MAPPTSWNLIEPALYFKIFENFPLEQYGALSTVCTNWNKFFEEKALWMPVCETMLGAKAYEKLVADNSSPDFKAIVKSFFDENKAHMELIVYWFNDDAQLRNCLYSTLTLQEFKAKSSLDRSRLLWKALHTDATPILRRLIAKSNPSLFYIAPTTPSPAAVAYWLIKDHQVPCNMVDVICSTFESSAYSYSDIENMMIYCIKSHTDLSGVEHRVYRTEFDIISKAKSSLLSLCNFWIAQDKITRDDLIACKLIQKEENGD